MAVDSRHPLYADFINDWMLMRDSYRGERMVKEKGVLYLPATSSMRADGMEANQPGRDAYNAYKERAVFPDFVADAIEAMIGMMHRKPPTIELPTALEPLRENATLDSESLEQLLRRINEQQLVTGRMGLMLDLPINPTVTGSLPYIAVYNGEHIVNWDEGAIANPVLSNLNLVVLDESEWVRQSDFNWQWEDKFRVLFLGDPVVNEALGEAATYQQTMVNERDAVFNSEDAIPPMIRGRTLDRIPFVFINSKDIISRPDDPPLLGLARLVMAIYRGEADYRQALFMQAQDTLVVIGQNDEMDYRIGPGSAINLPIGGDAKYIGAESSGLPEQRQSLENDREAAGSRAAKLVVNSQSDRESGEALRVRIAAQTATLTQIAKTGAAGLENLLKDAAVWIGADPELVRVKPNLEFSSGILTGRDLVDFMSARTMGAPLSLRTIHGLMQERGVTTRDFEEELEELDDEDEALDDTGGTTAGGNPPVEDDEEDEGAAQ